MIRVDVILLTEALTHEWVKELVELDRELRGEFGILYSHLDWVDSHFLHPVAGKWELSHVGFDSGSRVSGFWVASRHRGDLHTHRVGVAVRFQSQGIGDLLFRAVLRAGETMGLERMTLTVSAKNSQTLQFYENRGFVRQDGEDIEKFLRSRNRSTTEVRQGMIWEEGRYPYYLYCRPLGMEAAS